MVNSGHPFFSFLSHEIVNGLVCHNLLM